MNMGGWASVLTAFREKKLKAKEKIIVIETFSFFACRDPVD